ncbi:MAG: cytochrome c [Candidatus Hydrogenedentes bacterium]|nr:cytochrome c [Candidatus Hydrogenedentota bacterium]MBI3119758.1 cytochrome c [Candidatus Hydrogenedentota bacterium]
MKRTGLNLVLSAALFATVLLAVAMRRDPSQPNLAFMREMVDSIPYDAFARNPVFPDGRTMQAPIPGTIARGELPLHYAATPEDALRAAQELKNPFMETYFWSEDDEELLAQNDLGGAAFRISCLPCHGAAGHGDGPVALRGFPPPPSLAAEKALNLKDGQMFHIITFGQGNMPGYAAQVSPEDRWRIILYIRSLQQSETSVSAGVQK